MNTYTVYSTFPLVLRYSVFACLLFLSFLPYTASASHTNPTCVLTASTTVGRVELKDGDELFLKKNDVVSIEWKSDNVKKAFDSKGNSIALFGVATSSALKKTTFEYTFTSGSKKVTCDVVIIPVNVTFTTSSLITTETKPVISGKAVGTKTMQFKIYREGSKKALFTSKVIKVKNGKWSSKISKTLSDGRYDVVVLGDKKVVLRTVATSTLTIGTKVQSSKKIETILVVKSIPLLSGGIARGGGTVAVSYLQVINIGKEPAVVKGFTIQQNGSAMANAVVGLTSVDDTGLFKGSIGGILGPTPFKDGTAYVPVSPVSILAGQTRLFTLKAILSPNIAIHVGKQLKLDVIDVDTTAKALSALFPIRGTTWVISF